MSATSAFDPSSTGFIELDLADVTRTASALEKIQPDVVIHAAGRVSGTEAELGRDNVAASVSLAKAIVRYVPTASLIVLGSAAEYGLRATPVKIAESDALQPVSAYGQSKREGFLELQRLQESCGLRLNYLRIFNPIGAGSKNQVIGSFIQQARNALENSREQPLRMGNLSSVRDFIALSDVARFIAELSQTPDFGRVINVCSGQGLVVRDVVDRLSKIIGAKFRIESDGPEPPLLYSIGDETRFDDVWRTVCRLPRPISIEEALNEVWEASGH